MKLKVGHLYLYKGEYKNGVSIWKVINKDTDNDIIEIKVIWDNKADGIDWTNRILPYNLSNLEKKPETELKEIKEEDIVLEMI